MSTSEFEKLEIKIDLILQRLETMAIGAAIVKTEMGLIKFFGSTLFVVVLGLVVKAVI